MGCQRLQFGGEDEVLPAPAVKQRLLTKAVAGERQRPLPLVPQRQREHAGKAPQRRFHAPMPDGAEQGLRVGVSAPVRRGTSGFQFASDIEMIVDFAVERHRETTAVAVHGLTACLRQVENRKPAVTESHAGGRMGPVTRGIRSAIRQRISHVPGRGRKLTFIAPAGPQQTRNAAHQPARSLKPHEDPTEPSRNCCHSRATAGETGFKRLNCI